MIGVAYVLPFELRQFLLFHAIVHIDATAKTNKEERPLLTVTSKDSRNKMFTVLRAFLPNEQSWTYRWLFQTVFPSLFGQDILLSVNAFITDGDAQEISQLEDAMARFCPQAQRIRCSWHIIDRGLKHHVESLSRGPNKNLQSSWRIAATGQQRLCDDHYVARSIYRWMFSWAQPGFCIDQSEYEVSKAIF